MSIVCFYQCQTIDVFYVWVLCVYLENISLKIDVRDVPPHRTLWWKAGLEEEQSVEFKLVESLISIPSHLWCHDTDTDVKIDIFRRSIHAPQIKTIWEGEPKIAKWLEKKQNQVLY